MGFRNKLIDFLLSRPSYVRWLKYGLGCKVKPSDFIDAETAQYEINGQILHCLNWQPSNEFQPLLFYCHGGGFVQDLNGIHWRMLNHIIQQTGAAVFVPQFHILPQGNQGQAIVFLKEVYQWLPGKGVNQDRLVMMGDSAGANLLLSFFQNQQELLSGQIFDTLLISPWLDLTLVRPSLNELLQRDKVLNKAELRAWGQAWVGGNSPLNIKEALRPIGRLLIVYGEFEIFAEDIRYFSRKASLTGSQVCHLVGAGMQHNYPFFPYSDQNRVLSKMATFIKEGR